MRLRYSFLMTFSFFLVCWGAFSQGKPASIQQIDAEIQQLEKMKRGYESRALKHENQAEYLQFDQQAVLETRRHLQLAEENRRKAALVQERINQLMEQKKQLKK